jgi:hypothetical protein
MLSGMLFARLSAVLNVWTSVYAQAAYSGTLFAQATPSPAGYSLTKFYISTA